MPSAHGAALSPCPGCGALFPPYDGPTHRYVGASAGCWAVFHWGLIIGEADPFQLISKSRVPETGARIPQARDGASLEIMFADAYGVQHHGDESPQAIQSVAVHLLNIHGIISGQTTQPRWALGRAIRVRGVFHKLEPPPLGSALTIRHLFPGGGVTKPVTRHDYALSVYEAWMALHRATVEEWYESFVIPDKVAVKDGARSAKR